MTRVGIFSGSFDPPHEGHRWIIEQTHSEFDYYYIVVSNNPGKTPRYSCEQREKMLHGLVNHVTNKRKVICSTGKFPTETFPLFLRQLNNYFQAKGDYPSFTLIRGIRNEEDFEYEEEINDWHLNNSSSPKIKTIYLIPPRNIMNISSSAIKANIYGGVSASKSRHHMSTSGHLVEWTDDFVEYKPSPEMEKARLYYDKCVAAGIIQQASYLTADQVRQTLDAFDVDVVTSKHFILRTMEVSALKVLGGRFQPCSTSCGPVIVDCNYEDSKDKSFVVIEGKHRFLDAIARGDKTIQAYVGIRPFE